MLIKTYENFIKSLKLDKRFLKAALLELGFYALLILGIVLWSLVVTKWADIVGQLNLSNIADMSSFEIESARNTLAGFWTTLTISTLLLLIFSLAVYTFFKGYVWNIIQNKKPNLRFFLRFALLNLCLFAAEVLLVVLISFLTQSMKTIEFSPLMPALALLYLITEHPYFSAVLILLLIHITALIQVFFVQKQDFSAVIKAFACFKKFHLFLLSYVFIIIPLILILAIGYLLQYLPSWVSSIISAAMALTFIAWIKFYLVSTTTELR